MNKVITINELPDFIKRIRGGNNTLVLVGGCFDLLHRGHFEFLKAAKNTGTVLLVMLESDKSITERKGTGRPINIQELRAKNLSAIPSVDYILLLPHFKTDPEYYNLVKMIEPDIIAVTKSDPAYNKKSEQAEMVGGKIIEVIELLKNHSTTHLLTNT